MPKKKILHIVEAFGGGVFTVLCDLLNGLSDEYEIVVAYATRPQTPENFNLSFNDQIKFIEVKNFTRKIQLKKDLKALSELRKIVKAEKPDIIHLHSSKAGIIGRIAIHDKKIKMFYNPHGFSFLKLDDSKIKRFIYKAIEKLAAILNPRCVIVGCSKGEYEEALRINKNSLCINNGIDIEKLKEETRQLEERKIDSNNIRICTVGRIGYQKNPELINQIAQAFPDIPFTWIGDGELKNKLTSPNIQITGWKEHKQVLKIINDNDIFILASLWEGLPISLLEAMFMRKLCIVSNVIGNKDVIINGKNGFIANKMEDFISTIQEVMANSNLEEISNRSYNEVIEQYSMKNMLNSYQKLYEYGE